MPGIAFAQEGTRAPIQVELEDIAVQRIILRPSLMKKTAQGGFDPAAVQVTTHFPASRGDCPEETFTHSDSDWGPGEYVLQAGIVGGETAAASYTLTADKFPLRLDLFEVLFATALCGGVLAYIAKRRGMESIPYAPAIAAGYGVTMAVAWSSPRSDGLWEWITGGAA